MDWPNGTKIKVEDGDHGFALKGNIVYTQSIWTGIQERASQKKCVLLRMTVQDLSLLEESLMLQLLISALTSCKRFWITMVGLERSSKLLQIEEHNSMQIRRTKMKKAKVDLRLSFSKKKYSI